MCARGHPPYRLVIARWFIWRGPECKTTYPCLRFPRLSGRTFIILSLRYPDLIPRAEINVPITYKSNSMIICPAQRARCVDFLLDGGKSIREAIQLPSSRSQEWNTGFCLITRKGSDQDLLFDFFIILAFAELWGRWITLEILRLEIAACGLQFRLRWELTHIAPSVRTALVSVLK